MPDDEAKQREERERDLKVNARVDGVVFTTVFFGYVWLLFKGGLSEYFDELTALLPNPWGQWNGVAIAIGIGVYFAHRAITGRSWFSVLRRKLVQLALSGHHFRHTSEDRPFF